MLLFQLKHVKPILEGQKTQTRRPGKKRWNIGAVHQAKRNYLKSGFFAKLHILDVYQEVLGDVSEEDAFAEGGYTRESYLVEFRTINKIKDEKAWQAALRAKVWVVKFEVVRS